MSRGLEIIYQDEPDSRSPKRFWLPAVASTLVLAMLVLGLFESPVPSPSEMTAPLPVAIATMPDLNGSSFIAAGSRLSEAGLDRSLLGGARWVANSDVAPGTVAVQSPPPGTAVFHEEEIEIVMSSFNIVVAFGDEVSDQTRGQAIAILASFEPAPSYVSPEDS